VACGGRVEAGISTQGLDQGAHIGDVEGGCVEQFLGAVE
jgi:hypothetical protein